MAEVIAELTCTIEVGLRNGKADSRYLVAVNSGGMQSGCINSNATTIGVTEQFTFHFDSSTTAPLTAKIETCFGTYLKIKTFENLDPQNSRPLHCNAVHADTWEQFVICLLDTQKFAIRAANGNYLSATESARDDDPFLACISQEADAAWFSLMLKQNSKVCKLPDTHQYDYTLLSTDLNYTEYLAEEYVMMCRESHETASEQGAIFPADKLHVWAGSDSITAVTLEDKSGAVIGVGGIETEAIKKYTVNITQAEYISRVSFGVYNDKMVAIMLHDKNGRLICEFACADVAHQYVDCKLYMPPDGYGLVGIVPGPNIGEDGALTCLEALFRSVPKCTVESSFNIVSHKTDEVMGLQVIGLSKSVNICRSEAMMLCGTGNTSSNSITASNDHTATYSESCDLSLSAAFNVTAESLSCRNTAQIEAGAIYVHELTVGGSTGGVRLYGALTTSPNETYFPKGACLRVLGNDNEFFEFELSNDHFTIDYGESIFYFADDKPQNSTFTFLLSICPNTECFFEVQCISDNFNETEQRKHAEFSINDYPDSEYPYFRRPIYKMSAVLNDGGLSEPPQGMQLCSLTFSSLATGLVAIFGMSSGMAVVLAGTLVAATVGVGIYGLVKLCTFAMTSKESASLKKLFSNISDRKSVCKKVLDKYNAHSQIKPEDREWMLLDMDSMPRPKKFAVLIFRNACVNGITYSMSDQNLNSVISGFQKFKNQIKISTNYNINVADGIEVITQKIDITSTLKSGSFYISYSDILPHSHKIFPAQEYPYLFAVHPGIYGYAGLTMQGIDKRQSFVTISAQDGQSALDTDYICSVFTHEFIHVLEAIKNVVGIPYPSPDGASGNPSEGWIKVYGANDSGLNNYMAYYCDILRAAIEYQPPGQGKATYAGTFHSIWNLEPGFSYLGIYRIRTFLSTDYLVADPVSRQIKEAAYAASEDQYWVVLYEHEDIIRISSYKTPSLFWDIEQASITGKIQLGNYQGDSYWKRAQQFKLEQAADGKAKIISTVVNTANPNQKSAVQMSRQSSFEVKLDVSATKDEQMWVFETVKP